MNRCPEVNYMYYWGIFYSCLFRSYWSQTHRYTRIL